MPGLVRFISVVWGLCLLAGGTCQDSPSKARHNCTLVGLTADCSHMKLNEIPSDLPENITGLDISHNQLKKLSPTALGRYPQLSRLHAGFNNIQALEETLCRSLPLLLELHIEHNQVHLLSHRELSHCRSLNVLNLSNNKLKLQGDPFWPLQSLKLLDVSSNGLTSAKLGNQIQLWSLEELSLSSNKIPILKEQDFFYLSNSSLRILWLESLALQKLESGCFKPVLHVEKLVMDSTKLDPQLTSTICQELSGSRIQSLSLQKTQLTSLNSETFRGLQNTNLTILDLSRNEMVSLGNRSFQWLKSLQTLILDENNFAQLTKDSFLGMENLQHLSLKRALIKHRVTTSSTIQDFTFQPLGRLEFLFLDQTCISGLTQYTFTGLRSIVHLSLSESKAGIRSITNMTFASLAGSPLQTLNLTMADITFLGKGAFSALGNLTKLLLSHNLISQTLVGEEFRGLKNIQEISLSYNFQKITLTPSSFHYVPSLKILLLACALSWRLDLEESPFQHLKELSILDLSNNNIANIDDNLFSGLDKLKVLRFQHNNLARIWKNANPGGPVLFLKDLHNLTTLLLDNNGLDEIPDKGLLGLRQLRELSFAGNLLNVLEEPVFSDLVSLRYLNLQKNLITAIPQSVFKTALQNLSTLQMDRNPFDCTCDSILWFANWLNSTRATIPDLDSAYLCNTPLAYYNKSVRQFDPLSCKDLTPFQALYVLSYTIVLLVMSAALLFRFQGWRIQFYWNVLVSRTLGYKEVDQGDGRFEHDAYVIHAPNEKKWVERHLVPMEKKLPIRFCLEDRDFTPGASRLESIVEMITQSRKIIFVVTESLLKDPWCRQFKAHHAISQVIEDSRDSLVLVFLEEVPDHCLSRMLLLRRGMLRSRCLLTWPPERERRALFYQRLQVALGSSNRMH